MRYVSLFSGIEAASVAFHPLDGEICRQDEPITAMCGYFDGKWDEESVLAWRPLPDPYHPQKLNNADEDTAQSGLQSAT